MNRKIVIGQCIDCPFVDTGWGLALEITKEWPNTVYYCTCDLNAEAHEKVDKNTIPDWCPLEIDESFPIKPKKKIIANNKNKCKHIWIKHPKIPGDSECKKCKAHGREWMRWNPKTEKNEKRIRKCL